MQLNTSSAHFTTRDGMDSYLARGVDSSGLVPAGIPFLISASVAPGATAAWSISFQPGSYGISEFGVYPVTVQLQDLSSGSVLSSDRTLLPSLARIAGGGPADPAEDLLDVAAHRPAASPGVRRPDQ